MLSIRPISSGGSLRTYLEKEAPGYWVGSGSEVLGLPQQVTAEEFRAVRLGRHPETDKELRIRKVVDRVYQKPWGKEVYKARELYDLTISAPKSVSVMGVIDPRISEAHQQSVRETWQAMERLSGAMVIAEYHHHYSRALDPQEHTHLLAGNLALDGARWRTLHVNNLYRAQRELTKHYREKLLGQLEREGYRIAYPELTDVPKELLDRFSQRTHERDEGIRVHAERYGINPGSLTNREIAVVVRDHRSDKQILPQEQIREIQIARLTQSERITLRQTVEKAYEHSHKLRLNIQVAEGEEHTPSHRLTYGQRISM